MTFLVRQIDLTVTGREIIRERTVDKDTLTIGRSAENDIPVPDLAVEQHHLRVSLADAGRLRFEALGTLGFSLDGRTTTSATADGRGAEIVVGSHRLDFAADGEGGTSVTVRRMEDREGDPGEGLRGFGLGGALPGKRPLAWLSLALILVAFLAIPIWSHLERQRVAPDIERGGAVLFDASWSPGALSSPHHALEGNCEACHVDAFVAVRDTSCLSCHKDIGDHAAQPRLTKARGPLSFGESIQRTVADTFHKPEAGACTDCHTEHEGAGKMAATPQKFCADCHATLDARLTDTTLGDAADFGTRHPEFKAAIFAVRGEKAPERISLAAHPRESNGLRFPHALHLDAKGGVTRMATRLGTDRGYGSQLECGSCHRKTADGVRFLPIDMEQDCESCHSLVYDRVGTTYRTLRHGNLDQMRADLAAADRSPRSSVTAMRRRPGEFARGGLYYGNFGTPPRAYSPLVSRALAKGGVCGECHYPATVAGQPGVVPVTQPERYFAHGWFDHEAHKQQTCTSCHAATKSDSASDLLLPDLKSCRTCHQGEEASKAKVPSGCAMCHSYHPGKGAPLGSVAMAMGDLEDGGRSGVSPGAGDGGIDADRAD